MICRSVQGFCWNANAYERRRPSVQGFCWNLKTYELRRFSVHFSEMNNKYMNWEASRFKFVSKRCKTYELRLPSVQEFCWIAKACKLRRVSVQVFFLTGATNMNWDAPPFKDVVEMLILPTNETANRRRGNLCVHPWPTFLENHFQITWQPLCCYELFRKR